MNSSSLPATPSSFLHNIEPKLDAWTWLQVAMLLGVLIYSSTSKGPLHAIPAVGHTGWLSYIDAIRFIKNGNRMLSEGYYKYKPGIFRVPELNRWSIIVTDEKFIEEMRRAPDDVLSLEEAVNDVLAADYTLGKSITKDMYHIGVIRSQLTRNIANVFPDLRDELLIACEDYIPITEEWSKVKALQTVMTIISRTSNRVFVGKPTCRDPEYIALNIQFTVDVVIGGQIINLFPKALKPLVGRWLTNVPKSTRIALKHLAPVIEERLQKIEEYGKDYPDKPKDLLAFLMDEAQGEQRTVHNLTLRILAMNFAAIHTTSVSFTHALFYLATRPEYIKAIREEVEMVISEEGWSKKAMTRMRKLDSFLKESQRIDSLVGLSVVRKVTKDFTFSDGTRIPKGSFLSAGAMVRHHDDAIYPNALTFDGSRFSNLRDGEGEGAKNQMVATTSEYLAFGHGKHACPGRFFVATQLKALMAHMVLTYDIKMENEGVRPENEWYGPACVPNSKAEVLFRRRRV